MTRSMVFLSVNLLEQSPNPLHLKMEFENKQSESTNAKCDPTIF